ncbi:MAG: SinR family protein [Leptothrix sp. (in: Bacteria)]|nr:SinR family protein [Leptothrix sp. (in: b-proteobacteria)]
MIGSPIFWVQPLGTFIMAVFLVSYDLDQPGRDYPRLYEALKSLGVKSKPLESVVFISSNYTATQIRDYLQSHIDSNDKLLVVQVAGDVAWIATQASGAQLDALLS